MPDVVRQLEDFNPAGVFNDKYIPAPGSALLLIHPSQQVVLRRCAVAAFMLVDPKDKQLFYKTLTFIAPPELVWAQSEEETFELLLTGISEVRGRTVDERERSELRDKFKFFRMAEASVASVALAIEKAGETQFVFLPYATIYRDPAQSRTQDQPRIRLHEDAWVSHTAELARRLTAVANERGCFILMTTAESAPSTDANSQLLLSAENFNVYGLRQKTQDKVVDKLAVWTTAAASGRTAQALTELEAENLPALEKKQARMQIAAYGGDHEQAAALVRELRQEMTVTGGAAVQWAGICLKGDDSKTASELIAASLDALTDERELREALRIATQSMDSELVERAWNRLTTLFGGSSTLHLDCEQRLLQICALAKNPQKASAISRIGFLPVHDYIAGQVGRGVEFDYSQPLRHVENNWPEQRELACICFARHAEAVEAAAAAWVLASELIPDSRFSRAAAQLTLRVMQSLLLVDAVGREQLDVYRIPIEAVLMHLADHPDDGWTRGTLLNTLEVERSGSVGYTLLIALALDVVRPDAKSTAEAVKPALAEESEFKDFLNRFGAWHAQNKVFDMRRSLPADVVGTNAAGLARLLAESLEQELFEQNSSAELQGLDFQATLLPAVARHVPGETCDIHALRALAGRYSLLGDNQRARDLAESILQVAGDSPARRRLAWGAYADIYLRAASTPDALIGIICASATQAELPKSDLAYEVYTQFRAIRDIGFVDQAAPLLEKYRQLQEAIGMTDPQRNRLGVIGLTLRLKQARRTNQAALLSMLQEAHDLLEEAIRLSDELFASAFLFGQLAAYVELAGGTVPQEAVELKQRALGEFDAEMATYLRALSTARPALQDLVELHNWAGGSRYASDAPNDATAVQIAAHRLLRPATPELPVHVAFLGCELLAERGVKPPGNAAALTAAWPLDFAADLVKNENVAVLMVAFDDEGEVITACAAPGAANVVRPAVGAQTAKARLQAWSRTYPYKYGDISPGEKKFDERSQRWKEEDDSEFYASMKSIDVPLPAADRVLVVAEPELAQLTFNLVLKNRELAGYDTALAMVPSLSWLAAVRQRPSGGDGRRLAWLSGGGNTGALDAMQAVHLMTQATLAQHAVALNTAAELPEDFQGAQMAIVTAHGQLGAEGRFIHRVVDEGTLKESPLHLANALTGVELAILFVCSGGRVDSHPNMSTTVGLPKMLLDRGCRTVIASPWPLESLVPGWWLPAFLDAWAAGKSALEACHAANRHVASLHAYQPQRSLAMMVYGDPLLRSSPASV
ncbi:CHAT domain-containing protein [Ramlibacter humi]|uniref:CHAT domain-containing protein n=1 Tax=Ramlibacter humi TaxID=2530451 RepID=A0A4Z0CEC9_9BURK|nr:CHAT domain-containing protein [Ramlibacter humi]TFZ08940.1 CHAT domain-containing protein [Ramlibacter humi]